MSKYTPFNTVDDYNIKVQQAKAFLGFSSTADVVEVVRCKDCKYCKPLKDGDSQCDRLDGLLMSKPNDFCSYGERKEE